ncbi:sterol desaturase family protein [Comamonas antarctica]|uniref:Sterol desaturase family protein n=1 Tax=Comamonas antarctica TaxID=2743470 RepID=A0A6N1X840_9BURK|nr:sterol desaturase family protein [Comamonas antarctica]QKV54055.1 sterol desaturase family protein [Comamonas antarctica]
MDTGSWFVQLDAWQVMALGLVFFGSLYCLGGWGMTALTRSLARRGIGRVLDARALKPDQLRREWRQSLHSVLIFGIGMVVPWGLLQLGWAQLAPSASAGRIALEIAALLVWNDVHFWLNHRLLHTRRLVRFHGDHHRSVVTTPWSTYSFHPIEAIMLGNIILLPMLVHDFYFWSLASVPVLSLLLNVIGHANYDFFPRVSDTHPLAASRRHHLHHARPAGNYGFALAFMDQLMRTRVESAPGPR